MTPWCGLNDVSAPQGHQAEGMGLSAPKSRDSLRLRRRFSPLPCRIARFLRPQDQERKSSPKSKFWAGYPADVHADIPADVRGQKLRSGAGNPGKTSISVRTSMTRRRGRPRPEGGERKLRSEKLRAEFSFPTRCAISSAKKIAQGNFSTGILEFSPVDYFFLTLLSRCYV